jgi:hypothetical protein
MHTSIAAGFHQAASRRRDAGASSTGALPEGANRGPAKPSLDGLSRQVARPDGEHEQDPLGLVDESCRGN